MAAGRASGAACRVRSVSFTVNGEPALLASVRRGDHVVATFEVPRGCIARMTFASFVAPAPRLDGSRLDQQALFSKQSGVFGAGTHSLAVDVFGFPGSTIADCRAVAAPPPIASERPDGHAVVVTYVPGVTSADPSATGTPCDGTATAKGKPCDGCVGHADGKNPPGQFPNDPNAGYECDRNHGVGQGNPAHSCPNFQVDLSDASGLVAAVFCVRERGLCVTTDRTDTGAVHGP
jgi:hypothetical protein